MENSTKALLIAAAVLIAIIIVALSISLLNSSGDMSESVDKVGEEISSETEGISQDAVGIIDDIGRKNLIKVPDRTITLNNKHYDEYFPKNPKLLLEPNTKYELSFDYKIEYAEYTVGVRNRIWNK